MAMLGAIPKEDSVWAEVEKGEISARAGFDLNGAWSPWYTVHKIMAGLLDAYLYCDNKQALTVEKGIADWTAHHPPQPARQLAATDAVLRNMAV